MRNIKLFSRHDLLVLIIISILSIILLLPHFFNQNQKLTATITKDSQVIKTIDLNEVGEGYYIDVDSSPRVKIRVEKGKIRFCDSSCPDKLCVNCGWLDSNADSAVCLPARVVISVSGQSNGSPDIITY